MTAFEKQHAFSNRSKLEPVVMLCEKMQDIRAGDAPAVHRLLIKCLAHAPSGRALERTPSRSNAPPPGIGEEGAWRLGSNARREFVYQRMHPGRNASNQEKRSAQSQ